MSVIGWEAPTFQMVNVHPAAWKEYRAQNRSSQRFCETSSSWNHQIQIDKFDLQSVVADVSYICHLLSQHLTVEGLI